MMNENPLGNPGKQKAITKDKPTRRDFLVLTTGAVGAVGAATALWPFVDSMNPAKDTMALATIDVDLAPIQEGQAITVMWQGKPVFIRNRTQAEIQTEITVEESGLIDPQTDADRVLKGKENWLVVVGICTHLGCVPLGQKASDPKGAYNGWFCPCHGSEYDLSGRVRRGPAPTNLPVPPFAFTGDTSIRIGVTPEELKA